MVPLLMLSLLLSCGGAATTMPPQDSIESPALRGLTERIAREPDALARFWTRLDNAGTPIVEPVPGDTTMRLVTFLWRDADAVRDVAVITPYSLIDIESSRMRRIPGTDVWYRSFRMPSEAVMAYRFGPDDSMVSFDRDPNLATRMAGWRTDPLNSATFTYADGSRASVLRLAAGAAAPGPGRRHGVLRVDTVPGTGQWSDLPVSIYSPPGPARAARPLVILMDGDTYLGLMHIDSLLDRLDGVASDRLPVVVLVPADRVNRTAQYDCNPAWSDFLAERLVPWTENRFGTSGRPEDHVVGGFSLGGLAAACAAVRHPDVFGGVMAQSGSFYRASGSNEPEALARTLAAGTRLPIRWSLSIGRLETSSIPSRDPSMLTASRHLRDVLVAKGNALDYREFFGGHEQVAWALQLPRALRFLLRR